MAEDATTNLDRDRVRICEVGPRDGLQNQPGVITTADKIRFVNALAEAGLREIEVSSFVSPKWVPQLADAAEVFAGIDRRNDVVFTALVPNLRGMERAIESGARKVAVFTAATDEFNQHNTNATVEESIERFRPVVELAESAEIEVRGYISCVVYCPYSGEVAPGRVAEVVSKLVDLGIDEIDLGETLGVAVPTDIEKLYESIAPFVPPERTVLHMHDTRGTGLACVLKAHELGVRTFDTSCGGLGGCPYAPGAAGNIATEDVVFCFERMGVDTGVDLDEMVKAGMVIENALGRPMSGRAYRARKSQCAT